MSENPLVGTWRLVSCEAQDEDGRITFLQGQDIIGFLTYTPDGHVSVQQARADRARLAGGDWWASTPAEIAVAAGDYFAYCGTYELGDGEVVHRVALSLMPNWMGGDQVRKVAFDGERLMLSTPPTPIGGRQQIVTLVWERT